MEKGKVMEVPSLLTQDEPDAVVNYSAEDVAHAFVKQYYNILQVSPKDAHNFYKDQSILSHQCADGSMKSATTLEGINDEIMASNIKEWNPDISTVHAQDSVMDSVIVGITGSFTDNDNVTRHFAQSFFLAPQEGGGFYVHNDILHFIEINNISAPLDDVANPLTAPHADDTAIESSAETAVAPNKDQSSKSTSTKEEEEDDTKPKVVDSSEAKDPPLPAEQKKKSQPSAWQTVPNMKTDATKVSYASILSKEGSGASFPPPQSSNAVARVSAKTDKQPNVSHGVPKSSVLPVKSATLVSNSPSEKMYDVKSIRVKDLPPKMTQESLLEVVKKFGPVKQKNIQIKEYSEDGYRYAFVEFDNPKSARTAVEARFIHLEDRECEIQYKRTSNQGGHNYIGKPQSGRGGFRNDNFWGREGEGRSSGSWGHKQNEQDNSGETRDYNYRRNRYFQDHPRGFN